VGEGHRAAAIAKGLVSAVSKVHIGAACWARPRRLLPLLLVLLLVPLLLLLSGI
jgi:hypothetical protein